MEELKKHIAKMIDLALLLPTQTDRFRDRYRTMYKI